MSDVGDGDVAGGDDDTTSAAPSAEPIDAVPLDEVADVVEVDLIDLVDAEVDAVGDAVDVLERERDEYLDALRRLQADFDNYRKRVQREVADAGDRALASFVEGLLPVLDAVDAARAHGIGEIESIASLLVESLAKQGLERVDPVGDVFDPTMHDAVMHEEGDGSGVQTVAEVYRAGWVWKGRVLRPSMVKVVG